MPRSSTEAKGASTGAAPDSANDDQPPKPEQAKDDPEAPLPRGKLKPGLY